MIAERIRARLGSHRARDERHAVIDIGSNTVRLVIYGGPPRAPAVLWNEKVSARLGRDLAQSGVIPAAAMDEALGALSRYALLLSELGIARIETVATAAPRDAANGPEFVSRVRDLGLDVRVLSGAEEACASAYGAIGAFPEASGIVADLGGGSLELVPVANGSCGEGATFPLGTLRLPALRASEAFDRKVAKMLNGAAWAQNGGPMFMIGGTWRAFATFAMRSANHPLTDPHGFTLGSDEAAMFARELVRAKPARLAEQPGISTMRAEKLPDAAALLQVLLGELRPKALIFSSWGLREGLYFRALAPEEGRQDPLLAGVMAFAEDRTGGHADPVAIAEWTAQAARSGGRRTEILRLAATYLALALHRVEPNLRAAHALEWALDKRWVGVDFAGRAMLAAALRGSLGVTDPHSRLTPLASDGELREATAWGLAFRLAQRLAAGGSSLLSANRLVTEPGQVTLEVPERQAALVSGSVEKDLSALAKWLDAKANVALTS